MRMALRVKFLCCVFLAAPSLVSGARVDDVIESLMKLKPETVVRNPTLHDRFKETIPNKYLNLTSADVSADVTVTWFIGASNQRVNNNRTTVGPDGTLYFAYVLVEDAGTYYANLTLTSTNLSLTVLNLTLNVQDGYASTKSVELQYEPNKNPIHTTGQIFKLWCIFSGYPLPVITWTKNKENVEITENIRIENWGRTLVFQNAEAADTGNYSCSASNRDGLPRSRDFVVQIHTLPKFIETPKNALAALNGRSILRCNACADTLLWTEWFHEGEPVNEKPATNNSSGYTLVGSNRTLIIDNFSYNDKGNYVCRVKNNYGAITADANLTILPVPPEFIQPPKDTHVIEGKPVSMNCLGFGAPKPTFVWKKNGRDLSGYTVLRNGTLKIETAAKEDMGNYSCDIANRFGNRSQTAALMVYSETVFKDVPKEYKVKRGENMRLSCSFTADSAIISYAEWLHKNRSIKDESFQRIQNEPFRSTKTRVLYTTITKATYTDAGIYNCVVRGQIEQTFIEDALIAPTKVTVQDIPEPPEMLEPNCMQRPVQLKWKAKRDNWSPISSYGINYRKASNSSSPWKNISPMLRAPANSHIFADGELQPWTNYTFRVFATNEIGPSEASVENKTCLTPPDVPDKNPESVNCKLVSHLHDESKINLTLSWKPLSSEYYNGEGCRYRIRLNNSYNQHLHEFHTPDCLTSGHTISNMKREETYLIQIKTVNNQGEARVDPDYSAACSKDDVPYGIEVIANGRKMSSGERISVRLGEPLELKCSAKGKPPPSIAWNFGEQTIQDALNGRKRVFQPLDNNRIVILNMKREDSGDYVCSANNSESKSPLKHSVDVAVMDPDPVPVVDLRALPLSNDSVYLTWKRPNQMSGTVIHYNVTAESVDGSWCIEKTYGPDHLAAKISNLTAFSTYRFRVTTVLQNGKKLDNYISATPSDSWSKHSSLSKPKIKWRWLYEDSSFGTSHSTIRIFWNPHSTAGEAPGFRFYVDWKLSNSNEAWNSTLEKRSDFVDVSELLPHRSYTLRVRSDREHIDRASTDAKLHPRGKYFKNPRMSIMTDSSIIIRRIGIDGDDSKEPIPGTFCKSFTTGHGTPAPTYCLHCPNRGRNIIECKYGSGKKCPHLPIQDSSSKQLSMALSPFGDYLIWKQGTGPLLISSIKSNLTVPILEAAAEISFLTLDWFNGLIFWVEGSDIFRVELQGLDTPKPARIASSPPQGSIIGLTCDSAHEMIYWVTSTSLYEADYDGMDVSLLLTLPVSTIQRDTLAVFQNRVYWVNSIAAGVYALTVFHIITGELRQEPLLVSSEVFGMRLYEDQTADRSNECERCSHICMPRHNGTVECICPWGLNLVNGSTCSGKTLGVSVRDTTDYATGPNNVFFADISNFTLEAEHPRPLELNQIIGNPGFVCGLSDHRYCYLELDDSYTNCTSAGVEGTTHSIAMNYARPDSTILSAHLIVGIEEVKFIIWLVEDWCIKQWDLDAGKLDTILCAPGIDSTNTVIDGLHWIVFWSNLHDEMVYKTDLVSGEEKSIISKEKFHSSSRSKHQYRLTCDPASRTVYWLSARSLNKVDYDGGHITMISSSTTNAHTLLFDDGLLFCIDSEADTDVIVIFNPIYRTRDIIFSTPPKKTLNHLSVGFARKDAEEATDKCNSKCSDFCRKIDCSCWCPLERPILVNDSRCIEPELILAEVATDGFNQGQTQLSDKNNTIANVSTTNVNMSSSEVPGTIFTVNSPLNRTCWLSGSDLVSLTCSSGSEISETLVGNETSSSFLAISQDGGTVFWNGRAKGCIDMHTHDNFTLRTNSYEIPETSPTAIDTSRKLAFWCDNTRGSLLGYRSLDNTVLPAQIVLSSVNNCDKDVATCTSIAVDEFKGQVFVIHGQSIKRVEYSDLQTREKAPAVIHRMSYKHAHSLEYYLDNLFWVGGVAEYGEFIDTIKVPPRGQSFVVRSRRRLEMKSYTRILQLQIQKRYAEEYIWKNPCNRDTTCRYFCFPMDPLVQEASPVTICYCPSPPTAPSLGKQSCVGLKRGNTTAPPVSYGSEIIVSIAAIAVLVMLAIILVAVICVQRKKRIEDLKALREEFMNGNEAAAAAAKTGTEIALNKAFSQIIPPEDLQIDKERILGSGNFGIVYEAQYKGHRIAAKSVKPGTPSTVVGDFMKEIKIMAYLGHHKNVVDFYGAEISAIDSGIIFAVLEFSPYGSLEDRLHEMDVGTAANPPIDTFLRWSYEIASGMEYVVQKGVVHGDLAARNVLLFENDTVKISDFGFSRTTNGNNQYVKKEACPIPFRWAAPETLGRLEFSDKADVWSYGVVVWEIFSLGQCPFAKYDWDESFTTTLREGLRHPKPRHASQVIYDRIMMACWQWKPEQRPSFKEIKNVINEISSVPINLDCPSNSSVPINLDRPSNNYT